MEARSFLIQKFPGVGIKFYEEFEGMESSVVFNLTNGSLGTSPSIIPLSLTRANNHLVIFIEDFRDILKEAGTKNLVKMSQQHLPLLLEPLSRNAQTAGLQEAADILASLAGEMTVATIARLGQEWEVEDLYQQLVTRNSTRWMMIKKMTQQLLETCPTMPMEDFVESLRSVSMGDAMINKLKANLWVSTDVLKDMIVSRNLTDNEQIELALRLGQRSLFNSLTRPLDATMMAVSDQEALVTCVDTWRSQTTDLTSTQDLLQILQNSGLFEIASEIKAKQQNNTSSDNMQSLANWSLVENIGTTAADIFLPILTNLLTIAFMVLLFTNKHFNQCGLILLLHWFPSALLFSIHFYFNHRFFGSSLSISRAVMAFLILLQPVSSTILHIQYLLKRASYSAGQAVESYKIKKILQLSEASVMMNNFTSLLVVALTLHLAASGMIIMTEPAILVVSVSTATLHLFKLVINIIMNYIKEEESFSKTIVTIYPILGSLTLKTVSLVVLFSSSTTFSPLYGCLAFLLALAANWQLEKKLGSRDNTEEEVKTVWIRAVEGLIFPLSPEPGRSRTSVLSASLQLLLGDLTAATLGFTVALLVGVQEGLFLTQNMVKALTVANVGLLLYNAVALTLSKTGSTHQTEVDSEQSDEEAFDLSPRLGNSNSQEPQGTVSIRKVISALFLPIALLLLLASPYPLLLYVFNTCPAFPSLPNSIISCSGVRYRPFGRKS